MPFKNEPELYRIWCDMRRRCYDVKERQYKDYGGRGISVCDAWLEFRTFERDMSPRPLGMTLDRIDNDAGYSPGNCRWATRKEQQRNQRVTIWLVIEGVRHRAVDLAEQTGMKTDAIVARAKAGLSYEEVISPIRRKFSGGIEKAWRNSVAVRLARTHCPHGHEWNEENTRINPQGHKDCRACAREKMRRRTAAKKLATP